MEEIKLNHGHKLKNYLKYELFKSIHQRMSETTFKFIRNKNYFKFYLEYTNLYHQIENLSINLENEESIYYLNIILQKIQAGIQI